MVLSGQVGPFLQFKVTSAVIEALSTCPQAIERSRSVAGATQQALGSYFVRSEVAPGPGVPSAAFHTLLAAELVAAATTERHHGPAALGQLPYRRGFAYQLVRSQD